MGASAFSTRTIFGALHGKTDSDIVYVAFFILAAAAIVFAIARIFSMRVSETLGQSYAIEFRKNFYDQLTRLPKTLLSKKRIGALSIRFVGDLGAMRDWASKGMTGIISVVLIVPAALIVLWNMNSSFAVIGLGAILLSLIGMVILGWSHSKVQVNIRKERANISIDMMERAGIAPELKLLGRLKKDFRLLDRRGHELQSAAVSRMKRVETLKAIPDIVLGLAAVIVLWVTLDKGLEAGTAAASLAIISIISIYLKDLAEVWDMWCAWEIARDKSQVIFDMETIDINEDGENLPNKPVSINVHNLVPQGFERLDTEQRGAAPISFRVKAGERAVLSGSAASLKRVVNMLLGFENPAEGTIKYGGLDKRDIAQKSFAKRAMFLNTDAPILQGSLRRNLTLGCSKRPDDAKVKAAIVNFNLADTLQRLGGLDGRVDEGGGNLTKSEILRLVLTRCYLAKPKIIIVDIPLLGFDHGDQLLCQHYLENTDATVLIVDSNACWEQLVLSKSQDVQVKQVNIQAQGRQPKPMRMKAKVI